MSTTERNGLNLMGVGVIAAAVCCGLPLLLAVGSVVTIAGVGLRNWMLGVAGLTVVILGAWELRRAKLSRGRTAPDPDPSA